MVEVLLEDNFNDNVLDTAKWESIPGAGGTITEQNQRLEINHTAQGTSILRSVNIYDLSKATIEADVVLHELQEAGIFLFVDASNGYYFTISRNTENLVVVQWVGGVSTTVYDVPYPADTGNLKIYIDASSVIHFYFNDVEKYSETYAPASKMAKLELRGRGIVGFFGTCAHDNFSATTEEVPPPPPIPTIGARMINRPIIDRPPEEE